MDKILNISSKDVSVVFQGAIKFDIKKGIESVKTFLPGAEIIISTWEGVELDQDIVKACDVIIYNKDPGAVVFCRDGKKQNQNRQIISSSQGIKAASRQFVLKLRSDMVLLGCGFLDYFNKYLYRIEDYKVFDHRIIINSLYTRDSHGGKRFLFHPSDWCAFGTKVDMLRLWDIPLAEEPDNSQYFLKHNEKTPDHNILTRWHAEQYFWLSALKKAGISVCLENWFAYNNELARESDISIVNNFIVLDYKSQFDIESQKYRDPKGDSPVLGFSGWLYLYKKYINKDTHVPFCVSVKYFFDIVDVLDRFAKHGQRFVFYSKQVKKIINEIINIFGLTVLFAYKILKRIVLLMFMK